jgi:hypothetical protein
VLARGLQRTLLSREALVQNRPRPFEGERAGSLQEIGERLGRADDRLDDVQGADEGLIEESGVPGELAG